MALNGKMLTLTVTTLLTLSAVSCQQRVRADAYPFMNATLPWSERVDDLVNRLTLEEMTSQMANGGRLTYAPAIDRLGVPAYPWGSECLRGDVQAGSATSFPQALGLSATFRFEINIYLHCVRATYRVRELIFSLFFGSIRNA